MLVRMLETRDGSQDGINIETFAKDAEVDIAERLAAIFIREGWAESARQERAVAPVKREKPAPQRRKPAQPNRRK